MRLQLVSLVWFFALGLSPLALAADADCCGKVATTPCAQAAVSGHSHANMPCCKDGACDMPCCKDTAADMTCCKDTPADMACCKEGDAFVSAIDVLIATSGLELTVPPFQSAVRQTAVVWFHRPVWVGRNVLQGKYLIEHDTDRMARGEPCTHIYAADDMTKPVVAFHCTHIDAERAAKTTVMLDTLPDGMRRLVLFQFAGDEAAHGYPTGR